MRIKAGRYLTGLICGLAVATLYLATSLIELAHGASVQNSDSSGEYAGHNALPDTRDSIEELRKRVDELERATRSEIEALRSLILKQETELAQLRQQPPRLEPRVGEALQASPKPRLQSGGTQTRSVQQSPYEISGAAQRDTFRRDSESATRIDNKPVEPAPAGYFDIPGTPARVKIDGYLKLDTLIDPRPAGNPDQFNTAQIPISQPGVPQPTIVNTHARETRVNLDFRSAVGSSGHEMRFFFEWDFFGSDGATDPRLRHAYGQYKNLLLGHTWSTWADPDGHPDTLDKDGPAGFSNTRQAQARFTIPLNRTHSLAFGVERPGTSVARTLFANGKTYNAAPDSVIRWRYEKKRGHVQVGTLLRALGYQTDTQSETVFGWGLNASTSIETFGLDSLQLYGSYGEGYARYIENLATYDLDVNNSGTGVVALPAVATYIGYTHHWAQRVRSTFTFGYDRVQNTAAQPDTAFSKAYYMSGNLVWNPVAHLNLGAEFLHGWHVQKNDAQGNANRIQFSIKYDIYRKE